MKYAATTWGGGKPIRIYGFSNKYDGYGLRTDKQSFLTYQPVNADPEADINMPGANVYYYEIDPNNFNSLSLENFRVFLGALFTDHQGFFIRTEGMGKGEFLFAFDLFGALTKDLIKISDRAGGCRPTTPTNPLYFFDDNIFRKLAQHWEDNVVRPLSDDNLMITMHRYSSIQDWHSYLKLVDFLNEQKSSFSLL